MFMYFVHLFVTDIIFISMAAKDMYSVWFHWTPSLDLSSARVFQVWLSRSHDQGLHRTIFFNMAPLFSMWHARTQQKGNGFLCKCIWNCFCFFFGWKKIYKVWQFFPNWYNWKSTRGSKTITKINLSVYLIKFNNKLYHNWNITISLQTCPEQWRQYHLTVCVYTFIQFKIKM